MIKPPREEAAQNVLPNARMLLMRPTLELKGSSFSPGSLSYLMPQGGSENQV